MEGTAARGIVCEGEQWDGQDSVAPTQPGSCSGAFSTDPAHASFCLGPDPNAARGDDPLSPLGARVSAEDAEAYAAVNVALVGRVAVYAGTCGSGEAGLEGASSCGATREARAGVYHRENTPGNMVHTATCFRVTGCYISESDCDQDLYHRGAKDGYPMCDRDNTAFGVQLLLA